MEKNDNIIKDIRILLRLKEENEVMKDRIIKDIRNRFEKKEEQDYYKTVLAGSFWSNCYIKYENNGDINKTPSIKEYLNKSEIT